MSNTEQSSTPVSSGKTYILYHAHCTDGTGSKYAAWKKFKNNAEYIAVNYGNPIPEMIPGSVIYIVDFSYPRDVLEALRSLHQRVIVLDHHKTAEEALKGVTDCHFDMTKSGAVLTWEHFHPNVPVPALLLDIQDRDLWQFKRENSKFVHQGISLAKGKMDVWDRCATMPSHYGKMVDSGKVLLKKQEMSVDSYVKNKIKTIKFLGYKVGITNTTDLASEIGNGICESKELAVDFAICYSITTDNEALLSFRSVGEMDVSEVAKKFGGGGHQNASGARVGLPTLIKILSQDM